ncbi:hypothetical protein ACLOJK_005450 [Asimina triloba]
MDARLRKPVTSSSVAIAAAALLTLLLHFTSHIKTCSAARTAPHTTNTNTNTNTRFIRTSCVTTTYPRLCYESLSSHASAIQTSPKQLASTALTVTLTGARSTSAMMSRLSTEHGLKKREVGAMMDCVENMADSVDELRQSIGEMGHLRGADFDYHMNNVQTWVSAALTDESTCMDGFAENAMTGKVREIVRSRMVNVAHLTSNALALLNNLSAIHSKSP